MLRPIFFNPFYKPKDTILVVGSGRSGTTWLGNIIGNCSGFLTLFEPFDYRRVKDINTSLLRIYIRHDRKSHYLDGIIKKVLLGKILNQWVLSQNNRKFTWRILIKEIRANLFLGYIYNKFQNPIVYIIRHPCATVLSRIESSWEAHVDHFLKQDDLMEDYLYPYEDLIKNANSDLERHTIMWCVENYIPIKQLKKEQYVFCAYENLVDKTDEEIDRLFGILGLKIPYKIDNMISKPTSVTNKKSKDFKEKINILKYWKRKLNKDEIRSILDISYSFGIDIYNKDIMPNIDCSFLK